MTIREAVVFILVRGGSFLVERRKENKQLDPGTVSVPGGHVEDGEDAETALRREMMEELSIEPIDHEYVSTKVYSSTYDIRIHFYSVTSWVGEIQANEAEELMWLPFERRGELALDTDLAAVDDYVRSIGKG